MIVASTIIAPPAVLPRLPMPIAAGAITVRHGQEGGAIAAIRTLRDGAGRACNELDRTGHEQDRDRWS